MEAVWYSIIIMMLSTYVVLDGFDFGAGILHLFVAKSDSERIDFQRHRSVLERQRSMADRIGRASGVRLP